MIEFNRQQTDILKQLVVSNRQPKETVEEDEKLSSWLEGLGINEAAKKIFVAEGYSLEEVSVFFKYRTRWLLKPIRDTKIVIYISEYTKKRK